MQVLDQTKQKMQAALEHLKAELKSIRTDRANPHMLDGVMVDVYGSPMRLRDIATVTTPESRQLLISPFDGKNSASIGKALEKANLGISPIVEGNAVRIKIPPMDTSVRSKMVEMCHKKREESKVGVRNIRRDANELIKKLKSSGDLTEDEQKKLEKQIQDLTDRSCKEADDLAAVKEKEVTTV